MVINVDLNGEQEKNVGVAKSSMLRWIRTRKNGMQNDCK